MPVEVLPEMTIVWPNGGIMPVEVLPEMTIVWPKIKYIKVVYIVGGFRAKTQWGIMQNVRKAEDASLKLWKLGYAVICPHTMTQHFQDECPDKVWLDGCQELLKRADAIYLVEGWQESEGSLSEYKLAGELGLMIMGNEGIEKTCSKCGCFYTEILSEQKCPRCKEE